MTDADPLDVIWSNTDFPYMCLRDEARTVAFKKAIMKTVKAGDVVLDVGSGSGIMALFATEAGAVKVYAVEIEHSLAEALRKTIKLNGLEDKIEVIEADIMKADLPQAVDVVIAEIIETGLLDEMQVPAMNKLRDSGIIADKTKIIPNQYRTFVDLVNIDNEYYGYKIAAPTHHWPFYDFPNTGWTNNVFTPISEKVEIGSFDFCSGKIDEVIRRTVEFELNGQTANALRVSGIITLADGLDLGSTNALNGDKLLLFDPTNAPKISLEIGYQMGAGLGQLQFTISEMP